MTHAERVKATLKKLYDQGYIDGQHNRVPADLEVFNVVFKETLAEIERIYNERFEKCIPLRYDTQVGSDYIQGKVKGHNEAIDLIKTRWEER